MNGTASLESKILHQLKSIREDVLYPIFLNLQKSYYALDREIFMYILEGYGVWPRAFRILRNYWYSMNKVAREVGY